MFKAILTRLRIWLAGANVRSQIINLQPGDFVLVQAPSLNDEEREELAETLATYTRTAQAALICTNYSYDITVLRGGSFDDGDDGDDAEINPIEEFIVSDCQASMVCRGEPAEA